MNTPDIQNAVNSIAAGHAVVVLDSESVSDTGFLVFAAELATTSAVAFAVRHSPGYLRVALNGDTCDRLGLPPVCQSASKTQAPQYAVSVDAAHGVGTGISAADRATTIRMLASPATQPDDLTRPGHVVVERAHGGGVLARCGPAEAAADLARLAGLQPCGVITELVSTADPHQLANSVEARSFAAEHGLRTVSIADVAAWRRDRETWLERVTSARLPTECGEFRAIGYRSITDGSEHIALVCGDTPFGAGEVLVYVHRECAAGDIFGSLECDCRSRLHDAMSIIAGHGRGVVLYLRSGGEASDAVTAQILTDLGVQTLETVDTFPQRVRETA
ncbi:3,4-dihydroxy-2-butanone-4-phosphate synthase [Hoyosella altamirensis]|uniref:3,4-dihydroxy-2-butanone-4-phosphate synthase n=1 Tax=Hoyosella altamirensis TaxID=616997 RepID=A0A839RSC1_9ACTN|nr:3,4-dihydroxy-2-butanone-4-phosphate synthase [Hoyosella altamirensis]MBB3039239.1 3,4-dihydroxy 2-butanone 4-phosphate synthase/GTP cyclohydrolase II [Hoyosella altamirensis]